MITFCWALSRRDLYCICKWWNESPGKDINSQGKYLETSILQVENSCTFLYVLSTVLTCPFHKKVASAN
jgi:hypothetical protein